MAKVRRVRRTKRKSRLKKLKNLQVDGASDTHVPMELDLDGPGDHTGFTKRKKRMGRKRGASDAGEADGANEMDDVAVATDRAVTRKGEGGFSEHREDGFDRGRDVDDYLRSNVEKDAERFNELRNRGARDEFDPELDSAGGERLGQFKAAAHLVRMYDHWTLNQIDRDLAIENASTWLAGFQRTDNVRKVLMELESKPIRDVYPLEVMLNLLETHPTKLPGVRPGSVIGNAAPITEGRVFAGHAVQIPVPPDMRLKAFALLGGQRPGYEFHPSKKDGFYTLLIDTPGEYEFALFAVSTQAVGKMTKELPGGTVERFTVLVKEMGRKEPAPQNL